MTTQSMLMAGEDENGSMTDLTASKLTSNIQKHMEDLKAISKKELKKRRGMQFNKLSKANSNLQNDEESVFNHL